MARAVVLPTLARAAAARRAAQAPSPEKDEPIYGGGPSDARTERDAAVAAAAGDDYFERLVKYIPAEALTFFLLVSSSRGIPDLALIAIVVVGAGGAVLWASNRNQRLEADLRQSTRRLAAFTTVAFLAWVIGTSGTVQEAVGLSQQAAIVITFAVAFLLPGVDEALAHRAEQKAETTG